MKKVFSCVILITLVMSLATGASAAYTLKKGSQCEAVVALQLALSQGGYVDEKYITGYFGAITEEAVSKYQKEKGLEADGVAGEGTLKALLGSGYKDFFDIEAERNSAQAFNYSSGTVDSSSNDGQASANFQTVSSAAAGSASEFSGDDSNGSLYFVGMSSDFVKFIQECLRNLGYLSIDKTTTYFGEMTEKAVIKFQSAHGISPSGIVDDVTLSMLVSPHAIASSGGSSKPVSSSNSGYTNVGSLPQYSSNEAANKAASLAMEQLGKSYKYNTRGPETFDCSGLVYYAYKSVGYTLPTSSSAQSQYEKGIKITSIYDLQVGDVVFFNTGNSYVTINHCGIYIGNGQFVHASSSAASVIVRSLDSGFYLDAFRWALRIAY